MIAVFLVQLSQPKSSEIPTAAQPEFELGRYGETVSHAEAEALMGYKIKLPTYIPAGNELRMIKVDRETRWSVVIYSPLIVNDSTKEKQLVENNGFIIINAPAKEVTDIDAEVLRFVEFGGVEITWQNFKGVGFEEIPLLPGYSEIHWWDDGLHRIIGARFDFEELTKTIESIEKD
jgi:hypothetical protein